MRSFEAAVVLADISGYTRFVVSHRASIVHAEQIISELMESVTRNAAFPLSVQKLEGDAAFMSAEIEGPPAKVINDVARQVLAFMTAFAEKQKDLFGKSVGGCGCTACQSIENLSLKVIMHAGPVLEKEVSGLTELAGEPVIVAHRLLKNSVEGNAYLLATEAVLKLLDFDPFAEHRTYRENVADVGIVQTTAYFPPGHGLDRQGVPPHSRLSGNVEGLRLFVSRAISKFRGKRREFRNLPD